MPQIKDYLKWPQGPVPPHARVWFVGIACIAVLTFVLFFSDSPQQSGQRVVENGPRTGDANEIRRISKQLDSQVAEMNRTQAEAAAERMRAEQARLDAERALAAGGTPAPAPGQPVQDPAEMQRQQIKLEILKRRLLRSYAPSETAAVRADSLAQPDTKPAEVETIKPAQETKQVPTETIPAVPETKQYAIREGTILETVLVNRLDSTFTGPVIVQVSENLYSRDRSTLLIPKGTQVIGNANAVEAIGQRRIAVVFHRLIRPDDVSIPLDTFTGLNQIGETGLRDKVNNHYMRIFGMSIALGVIGAVGQGTARYGYDASGMDYARQGFGMGMSQAGMTTLNRFLNIPPTVTIREGHRVKVFFSADVEVPAFRTTL